MTRRLAATLSLVLAGAACRDIAAPVADGPLATSASQASAAAQAAGMIPGQYIVVFRSDVTDVPGLARGLAAANGASVRFVYQSALKGFSAQMSDAAASALARNPNVDYVEQDQEVQAIATQTMDGAGDPWGLDRIDAASGLNGSYTYNLTGSGVVAYIIDTGIRTTHVDFGGRASGAFTSINDGNGTNDCDGHGTHVAGTVGGATYGVAKAVSLVAIRVLDCSGSGSWSGVIAGIDYVTANHSRPAVANMSLGGGASTAVDQAVQNSIASGVAYAVAAGNGNRGGVAQDACKYSPARVPQAMTIGATDKTDTKASWSNYGNCVDWFAPGVGIKSAWGTGNSATNTISGTSMATPHTAGVAALFLEANPGSTPLQVRDALYAAATKSIVSSSNTSNNHLLYSPPGGFGEPPPPPPNQAPAAEFASSCSDFTCTFTDGSSDSDGTIVSRSWSFGDGGTSTAQNPAHTYGSSGTYTVTLIVTDDDGATGTISHDVTVPVTPPPPGATLDVTTSKSKGSWTATLAWAGFAAEVTSVDVYRNGAVIATQAVSPSSYTDSGKGGGSLTYQVCSAGSQSVCTNAVTVSP